MEEILARNPQVIVDMGDMPDTELVTEGAQEGGGAVVEASAIGSGGAQRPGVRGGGRYLHCPRSATGGSGTNVPGAAAAVNYSLNGVGNELRHATGVVGRDGRDPRRRADVDRRSQRSRQVDTARHHGRASPRTTKVSAATAAKRSASGPAATLPARWHLSRRRSTWSFPFTAGQVVLMGRAPHASRMFEGEGDREAVERAMRLTDTFELCPARLPHPQRRRTPARGAGLGPGADAEIPAARRTGDVPRPAPPDLHLQAASATCAAKDSARSPLRMISTPHLTYSDRVLLLEGGTVARRRRPRATPSTPPGSNVSSGIAADIHGNGRPWIVYEP